MADAPERSNVDILQEYFDRRGVHDRPCPICEVDDWGVYKSDTGDLSLVRVPRGKRPMSNPPSALRLYVMVCRNCGFVRQHARRYVDGDAP
jgi:hypothetical protein